MRKRLLYLAVLSMAVMVMFAPAAMAQDRLNCVEVSTGDAETIQQQAQVLLNQNPNGPAQNLDANGNGIACEYTISAQSGVDFEDGSGFISGAQAAPPAEEPSGDQYGNGGGNGDTGGTISGGTLPDTGGASLFTLAGGALLIGGGLLSRRIVR